jgi:hypothetical protein
VLVPPQSQKDGPKTGELKSPTGSATLRWFRALRESRGSYGAVASYSKSDVAKKNANSTFAVSGASEP